MRFIRWYEDHGLTGTESSKRKDLQKLLADVKGGKFQAVLLSEQSRMSREDIFDCMQHWRLFRDAGVAIVTCQRGELKFDNLGGGTPPSSINTGLGRYRSNWLTALSAENALQSAGAEAGRPAVCIRQGSAG